MLKEKSRAPNIKLSSTDSGKFNLKNSFGNFIIIYFYQNCLDRHDPFEKYLNEIYQAETCISPVKSLSLHMTNINSSYGLSPFIDYKKLWDDNKLNA